MDWILHSISLPRVSYFSVVPPEYCRSNIVGLGRAQEKSMKQEERGQGTNRQNDIVQGHNISQLRSNGSKMADKSDSTKP